MMHIDVTSLLLGMIAGFALCLFIVGKFESHEPKPRRSRRTRKPRS
jgi:hypothetical protein